MQSKKTHFNQNQEMFLTAPYKQFTVKQVIQNIPCTFVSSPPKN